MAKNISRRVFLRTTGLTAVGALLAACAPQIVTQTIKETQLVNQTQVVKETQLVEATKIVEVTSVPKTGPVNALGIALPADAAPLDKQFWRIAMGAVGSQTSGATGHPMESLYQLAYAFGLAAEPLLELDKDGKVVGVEAESWKQSTDLLSWDFTLRKGLVFSDGAPIKAQDWVWTFQRSFSKGYDFGWMYADVLNSADVLAGKKPATELGIEAVDDYTLRVKTTTITPYIPAVMTWAYVAPKQAYDQYGDNWSVEPDHFITNGPWMLKEFERGVKWTFALNTKYKGIIRPYITEIRGSILPNTLAAYMNGEIDTYTLNSSSPAGEIGMVDANPVLRAESHPRFAGATYYIGFNTLGKFKEFTDPKVRLAMNKALDKQTIVSAIGRGFAIPAWGILPKGFVGNSYAALQSEDPNVFDVAAAKKLLADAGYPDGKGFSTYEMWMYTPDAFNSACAQAIQAAWKENLGINIKLVPTDFPTFNKNVYTDKVVPLYWTGYGLDYWDPATFMNVFRSGGRHSWQDKAFDDAFTAANAQADPEKRMAGIAAAEKILVDSCGFAFFACPSSIMLWPCNIAGGWTIPNANGYSNVIASPYSGGQTVYDDFYYTNSNCRAGLK